MAVLRLREGGPVPMNIANLVDGTSAAIVLGGTFLATWLRCGNRDCRQALRSIAQLGRSRFDAAAARAELSIQIREIREDGVLRAQPHHFGDREFDDVTDALIVRRSVP